MNQLSHNYPRYIEELLFNSPKLYPKVFEIFQKPLHSA